MRLIIACSLLSFYTFQSEAQQAGIRGKINSSSGPILNANILIPNTDKGTTSDEKGDFSISLPPNDYRLRVSSAGFISQTRKFSLEEGEIIELNFYLEEDISELDEVVVSGTLKEVRRSESPIPVEVYNSKFFKKNPTPSLYNALQSVNGVRPQLNCNVCNTGDIHINGLEGPYTMVLIDGIPIVSGLSAIYGLIGIPNSMIERIEIVKGPASTLYGSEAVAGLINVITKGTESASSFALDVFATNWQEYTTDISFRNDIGKNASILTGIHLFNYANPIDNNNDNFTDVTLQERISVFEKLNLSRNNRVFTIAGRYYYEDRWGGELQWTPEMRGGEEVYGENIITKRWELFGNYQLPLREKVFLSFSYNSHNQNSYYGSTPYFAHQRVGFGQFTWDKNLDRHNFLIGAALRYNHYDDNTFITVKPDSTNGPIATWMPGIFLEDDIFLSDNNNLLLGGRCDYHTDHGYILTPRLAYKWNIDSKNILRLNVGNGFRVVNLVTEEHAALTGARKVIIAEKLNPERNYNGNLNYIKKWYSDRGFFMNMDASVWYTYFSNQILPDYDTDPNVIIYDNLDGNLVSQGVTLNFDIMFPAGIDLLVGATYIDVYLREKNELGELEEIRPILTEQWTGTWAVGYTLSRWNIRIDYTGNLYGPMRLPILGLLDSRDEFSPWWSIQNIQLSWNKPGSRWEIYGGIKNLMNFTPPANSIARPHDPFDKQVQLDIHGNIIPTEENPHALTFDPSYVYAPNQGIRGFLGIRYNLRQ